MIQIAKKILLGFACLLFISIIVSWATPSSARSSSSQSSSGFSLPQSTRQILSTGDIEFTSVHLDGVSLFQIAYLKAEPSESEPEDSLSLLERRVERTERRLYNLIKNDLDPQTLQVRPAILNNLTVIVASDQKNVTQQVLVRVTEIDAQIDQSSVSALAEEWSKILREALIRSWQDRQPEARKRQVIRVVQITFGVMFLSGLLFWSQKRLRIRFNRLKKRALKQSSGDLNSKTLSSSDKTEHRGFFSEPLDKTEHRGFFSEPLRVFRLRIFRYRANLEQRLTVNILLQKLNKIGVILLWFGGVTAILYTFPETRLEGHSIIVIPLKIFIIWLVLTLIDHLVSWYINYRIQEWVEHGFILSEDHQRPILRAPTLLAVSDGIIRFISLVIGTIWFLLWRGAFPASLLAGVGVFSAALTFVFQSLLRDWVNGILIIFEDQYAVGDLIDFNGLLGIVENMTLRVTQIRTLDGRLTTIPHSQIIVAHNLTKDWSRVNFLVEVDYSTNPNVAIAVMKDVAQEMANDPQWQKDIIDPVKLIGVDRVSHSGMQIMMWIQVKRLRQIFVEQEFRRRLKLAFDEKGIQIGTPRQTLFFPESEVNKSWSN